MRVTVEEFTLQIITTKNKGEYAENLLKFTGGYAILLLHLYVFCGEGRHEIQRTYIAA